MVKLLKRNVKIKNKIFLKSKIYNINIFYIDKIFKIPKTVKVKVSIFYDKIYFKSLLGKSLIILVNDIFCFNKNNKLLLIRNLDKNKKSFINLYNKLLKIKVKSVLQEFKLNLILKGLGFKAVIEKNNLILKLGFSHNILINIPSNIKVLYQGNNLIFSSTDLMLLTQFVHYIKSFKKPEPYNGKGLLLKNEYLLKKEGKKSKK